MGYDNSVTKGDLSFGLSLMSHLGDGNLAVSPTSIRTALSMLYEGATGEVAKEIARVADLPEDAKQRQNGFKQLSEVLNAQNVPYKIRYANGLWLANNFPVNESYRKTLTENYGAEAKSVNFMGNPEGERTGINKWVSDKTEEKIPELFKEGSISSYTVLALANALYFKAMWDNKFDPQYTQKQDFTLSNGNKIQVDMMRKGRVDSNTLPKFSYGEFDGVQTVMLPYKGKQLVKFVLLPPKGSDVKSLEKHLLKDKMNLMDLISIVEEREKFERLEIPKHELRGSYGLVPSLTAMGMEKAFTFSDGLSGIGPGSLQVNAAQHETYFKTDEEGSEGAAATGFGVRSLGMSRPTEPIEFIADRPFLEVIAELNSDTFLFVNRVEDPRN